MNIDDAAFGGKPERDGAVERLVRPVESVMARPFFVDVETLAQLNLRGGLSRLNKQGALDSQMDRHSLSRANKEDVMFVDWFGLPDSDDRDSRQKIFRRTLHARTTGRPQHAHGEQKR